MSNISIILPNQLFENSLIVSKSSNIYLIEDDIYFIKYPFHKQKLIMHRASMKKYYNYLTDILKKKVYYIDNNKSNQTYKQIFINNKNIHMYDPIDHNLLAKFNLLAKKNKVSLNIYDSPLFIETNDDLQKYYDTKNSTNYIHDNGFYRWQRERLNVLMKNNKPLFNKLSFDHDNRKPFDKIYLSNIPKEPKEPNSININFFLLEAEKYINKNWPNNFGHCDINTFIWPIDFVDAKQLVKNFIRNKLKTFGKYEDAVHTDIKYGSHSILSSSLNIGLITIRYVLTKIIKAFNKFSLAKKKIMISNVEGFIRQLIGWRSYMRFIYKFHGVTIFDLNQFNSKNKLPNAWFNATTGLYPIDLLIKKVYNLAYAHHIERLMYLGNFALISQIDPKEIYKWFMICFIDSYEWVMIPNIMGMSQYSSDKIKIMTKPYLSSSNYIKNMSNFKLNEYAQIIINGKNYYWNEIYDSLYYNFINKNKNILKKFYSIGYIISHWNNKSSFEQKNIIKIASTYHANYVGTPK